MSLVWLPQEEWATELAIDASLDVEVWRPPFPMPNDPRNVTFYVPQYLGAVDSLTAMRSMVNLEVVQTLTAGTDDVLPHVPDHAALCNAAGVHDASTAELAVGLTIAALRGIPEFVQAQASGSWRHRYRTSLADRSVMVIGSGGVGSAIAARLAPFEVRVTRVARNARAGVVSLGEARKLLPKTDIVILAVPLTADTAHLVDDDFLAALPDGSLVVNVARGPVIDTDALVRHLRQGRLHAALDVTDPEPLPQEHPLWSAPNILITPHVGGDTTAFEPRAKRLLNEQLRRYAHGQPLANVVRGACR